MAESLVVARDLHKSFGDLVAVGGIDFAVERGEVFGFLGPDGARIRARLGVVPQEDNLDLELTVYENLLIYGRYFGLSKKVLDGRIDELLKFTQLDERRKSLGEPRSGGLYHCLTI